ncbi:MAG: hypothetical protein GY750_14710, partial [Lentisphaerae bacterium]|nr:hypothetical protein [Lentisphaerota bacterium]
SGNDNNEECTVASPQAGTYYISLYAFSTFSGVSLVASYSNGSSSGDDLSNGVPVTGLSASGESWLHYQIDVPSDSSNLTMVSSGGSGDADLYTRFGSQPISSTYDCRSFGDDNNEECTVASPQAGTYYISLYAFSTFSNVSLTASYSDGGNKTFIITAVRDSLDNQDMYDIADGLVGLGYTESVEDTNVSSSELIDYLGRSITTLYHTGHGSNGVVYTSDGSISASGTTLRAENTFFATCLTLTDTSWINSFSSSANTLMGYTKVSYDYTDETVAKDLIDELGSGKSYQLAWYLSNVGISSLNDRWAEYVRVGSSIVEYSARTGNIPSNILVGKGIALEASGRVTAASALANSAETYESVFGGMTATVESDAVATYADSRGFALLESGNTTEQEALAIAEAWLSENGGMPDDAVLYRVIPVQRKADENSDYETAGYSVHYRRDVDSVKVSGNYVEDHLTVLVGSDSVIATSRYWPAINITAADSQLKGNLLTVSEAVNVAADQIALLVKGTESIQLTDAEAVYGTYGPMGSENRLVPAFRVQSADGHLFVIDALTGKLLL